MANYRGLLWSLVAIAGTATAATVVYRYVTRPARPLDENESSSAPGDGNGTASSSSRDRSGSATSAGDYEPLSGDEEDAESAELVGVDAVQRQEQQLALVTREGNMLLSVFGLIMIMLVGFVGVIVSWSTEGVATPWELPMFQPLLWLAIGVFTAASVEVLSQSGVTTAPEEIPVLSDKAVFPHDQQDFDMIARHNGANRPEERAAPRNEPRLPVVRTVHEADEEEEKQSAPPLSDVPSLVARADELFAQNKHSETHTLLKKAIVTYPTEIDLLWRLTRACTNLVDELTEPEQKKAMAFEGLGYADKAYELNPNVAATNKWKGIMTGTVGNFRDLKEKIAGAYVIRDSIQRAVELDPQDATCHNILGQWCLAFADMTWIEKRAAAALFGTPPTATYDEAVQHFANAERISPGFWKKNVFLLAQTYHKMKRDDDAHAWLVKARDVPVKTKEDQDVAKDIDALMKKLKMGS